MRLTRYIVPAMVARGSGDIVNLTSITTRRIAPGLAAYSATKHAIHGFSEVLRAECGPKGVRVIELSPGVVRTGFASARFAGDDDKVGRILRPASRGISIRTTWRGRRSSPCSSRRA